MKMRYSRYLTHVLDEYKYTPMDLICRANKRAYAYTSIPEYYLKLQCSINKTFYNETSKSEVWSGFNDQFLGKRKPNSWVKRKLNTLTHNDRYYYMIRFRTKYLEQLIRLAKQEELENWHDLINSTHREPPNQHS